MTVYYPKGITPSAPSYNPYPVKYLQSEFDLVYKTPLMFKYIWKW